MDDPRPAIIYPLFPSPVVEVVAREGRPLQISKT